ncbi:unnamed protein product [Sphagnum jensenii]|uniref:Uncharacterized protein n=1 Tax=Sphagnum jensenii TaxID=128206 RepID=A0ABP0VQN9_9BRYO
MLLLVDVSVESARERKGKKRQVLSWWWCNVEEEARRRCAAFSLFSAALRAKKVLVCSRRYDPEHMHVAHHKHRERRWLFGQQ